MCEKLNRSLRYTNGIILCEVVEVGGPAVAVHARGVEERAIEVVANNYFDVYVRNLSDALRYALPNLEVLKWEDKVCITPELMNAIAASGVRELEMAGVFVDREFVVEGRPRWGLRRLVMNIQRAKGCDNVSTAPLCMSILKAAAQTLEELEWVNGEVTRFDAAEFDPPLRFPQLRSLVLQSTEIDNELFEALISENNPQLRLRTLTVASSSASEYLSRRGHIDTLQVYHTSASLSSSDVVFIGANSQLHKLTAPCPSDSLVLGTLLPTLTDFRHLTNLHLVWDTKTIDIRALESIGGVKSLTRLWLSAGTQSGNIHDCGSSRRNGNCILSVTETTGIGIYKRYLRAPTRWGDSREVLHSPPAS